MRLIFFISICCIFTLIAAEIGVCDQNGESNGLSGQEKSILREINRLRSEKNVQIVRYDELLTECAREYAEILAARQLLAHVDSEGRRADERYRELGGTALVVGELLGRAVPALIQEIPDRWLESPAHKKVLLNPEWTHFGLSTTRDEGDVPLTYAVLLFSHYPFRNVSLKFNEENGGTVDQERAGTASDDHTKTRLHVEGTYFGHGDSVICFYRGRRIEPDVWEPDTGYFTFFIEEDAPVYYITLGYTENGRTVSTNTYLFEKE